MLRTSHVASSGAIAIAGLATIASAVTIHVPSGKSIQAAVNAARHGDVIIVAPGVFAGPIDLMGKRIHLRSSDGADMTTIDAQAMNPQRLDDGEVPIDFLAPSAILCHSGETRQTIVEGFRITGGEGYQPVYPEILAGGGMFIQGSSPTVINCRFEANSAMGQGLGGGGIANVFGNPLIVNCVFESNNSIDGGAIYNHGDMTVINCTFFGNDAERGKAIHNTQYYGGFSHLTVANSILLGRRLSDADPRTIAEVDGPVTLVAHSIVAGGFPGDMVQDFDPAFPMFVGSGSYRLAAGSPAVDAGHNWLLPRDGADLDRDKNRRELLSRDHAGLPRVMDASGAGEGCGSVAIVDMGAFERAGAVLDPVLLGDLNGDGKVTTADSLILMESMGPCTPGSCCLADLDRNGMVDAVDLDILHGELLKVIQVR